MHLWDSWVPGASVKAWRRESRFGLRCGILLVEDHALHREFSSCWLIEFQERMVPGTWATQVSATNFFGNGRQTLLGVYQLETC